MAPPRSSCTTQLRRTLAFGSLFLGLAASASAQGTDACTTPTVVAGLGSFSIDNTAAAAGQDFAPGCAPANMARDVWFTWTAAASGSTTIATCSGVGFDSVLAVYNGSTCPGAASIACSDDSCGAQSSVTFAAVAAQSYVIQIGGYNGATGSGTFSISGPPVPPANDACTAPTAIAGAGLFPFTVVNATTGTQGQAEPSCNFFATTAIGSDVWYAWTAPSTGIATVSTCAQTSVDTKIAAYTGAVCPAAAAIACSDDNCALQTTIQFACQSGAVYMLQVGTYPGASQGAGNFNITVGAPLVKLSQIYGAGGNGQAPILNDYIEIYNAGPVAQPLNGWSVQYASSTGLFTALNTVALPNVTLAPGKYLLVNQGTGGTLNATQVAANPTGDATGAVAMSGTDMKVALVSSTTFIPTALGQPTYAAVPTLIDFVGIGTANWNDTAAAGGLNVATNNAPGITTSVASYRQTCGATDTNSSIQDWSNGFPGPRNNATVATTGLGVIGAALPITPQAGQALRLTATPFRCTTNDLAAGTTMSADLTLIGGSATATLFDNATNGDELANDGVYTLVTTVGAVASASYSLPIRATNGAATGGSFINVLVAAPAGPANDNCSSAAAIAVPSTTSGVFTGAIVESNPMANSNPNPTSGMSTRRGLWYAVTGTGNTMTASLCATLPALDSVMFVLAGTCDGFTAIAAGDDNGPACAGTAASAAWCSTLGQTYWVWIAPFSTAASTAAFTLNMTDSGTACTGAFPVTVCTGVAGPYTEKEAGYGAAQNEGCFTNAARFTDIPMPGATPVVLRGQARGLINTRDIDGYRFQATTTGPISITLDTFGSAAQAQFVSLGAGGICPATQIGLTPLFVTRCATGIQTLSSNVISGTWYAINVIGGIGLHVTPLATFFGGQMPGGTTFQYGLTVAVGGPPANDNCASAATLTAGPTYTAGLLTTDATNDGTSSCDVAGRDVWYSLTLATTSDVTIDTCTSAIDTVVSVYSVCGGAELACNDDCGGTPCGATSSCVTLTGLAAGNYRIRVSDKNLGAGGSFNIRAVVTLANDNCAGAQLVTCGSTTTGTTVGATLENVSVPTICTGPGAAEGGQNLVVNSAGVWYRTVGTGATVYADTLTASYDTSITVYTGTCAALTCVTVNDDVQGTPFHSKVGFQTVPGQDYYILVHGFGAADVGTFTLNVTCTATPSNDLCGSPANLPGTSGSLATTNAGSTGDNSTLTSAALATCATTYSHYDTWYSFTAVCSGSATFTTCGTFDTIASVHTACPSGAVSNQLTPTASSCNNDGGVGCTPGSSVTVAVVGGSTYLVRVATAGAQTTAAGGGQPYTLTWSLPLVDTDSDGTADCLDGCPLDPLKIAPGICGCGVSDVDTDGDGTADCIDGCPADPLKIAPGICGCGVSDVDTDGDGTADCIDGCPADPLKIAPGICGCGVSDVDTDGDGTADCLDGCPADPLKIAPGICGCGVSDVDTDGDGTANCIDGCPADPLKIAPGICGCGVSDVDSDGDGTADCLDGCPADPLKIAPGICGCGVSDVDTDGDGSADCIDGCPADPLKTAPGQCGCGVADVDTDGDSVANCIDNCDTIANLGQADLDGDAVGDACDNCVNVSNPTQGDCNGDLIGDACEIFYGVPDCNLNGIPDTCDIANATSADLNANNIPDECEVNGGTPYCFGYAACPCGNNSLPGSGQGCMNSTGQGAMLLGSGLTSLSADGLVLNVSNLPIPGSGTGFALFFQGDAATNVPFQDGRRCVSGAQVRLATKSHTGGMTSFPQGGDNSVSVEGFVGGPGARYYQVWYRNVIGPCGTGSNVSNGLSVIWVP